MHVLYDVVQVMDALAMEFPDNSFDLVRGNLEWGWGLGGWGPRGLQAGARDWRLEVWGPGAGKRPVQGRGASSACRAIDAAALLGHGDEQRLQRCGAAVFGMVWRVGGCSLKHIHTKAVVARTSRFAGLHEPTGQRDRLPRLCPVHLTCTIPIHGAVIAPARHSSPTTLHP